jgi:hypothetical protein
MNGHRVEILSMEAGESLGTPMALVLLRPDANPRELAAILFNQEQCIRLRDTLDSFLSDPQSSLYLSAEEQVEFVFEGE